MERNDVTRGQHASARPAGHRRWWFVLLGVVVASAVAATGVWITRSRASAAPPHSHTHASKPLPATFLGRDGVEAKWVIDENRKAGTTSWEIPATVRPGGIEGFANEVQAQVGSTVGVYVSTSAPTYRAVAYRMGWYQGTGARQVWRSGVLHGRVQPACPVTPTINMVSCANWSRSFSVVLTSRFVQGDYLIKLTGSGGQESYVLLTVWDPTSHATYLFMNRSFTEQGWNTFGGFSYYQGEGPCAAGTPNYPVCNRARVVSFDRPYDTGNGASDFFGDEYPLLKFCEQHGLDVTYVTDITVDEHPGLVAHHRVLLSLGHDESWSYSEREGLLHAEAKGLNVVFFGAASILRHVRLQASPLGPDRQEVDYRDASEDPLNGHGSAMEVTGNTWSAPPTDWSAESFVGEVYSGYLTPGLAAPFVVADASSWLYRGTGLHDGSSLPNVIRSDIDHVDPSLGVRGLMVLGHSPINLSIVYTNQGTWGNDTYSDLTYYTDRHTQSGILDTGNNNWINAMRPCHPHEACAASELAKITGNILWLFGKGPAGRLAPSVSNLATIEPRGS